MTTTTSYGTWLHATDTTLTVRSSIDDALGAHVADFDLDAIEADYRAAINAALPAGVTLAGDGFYGPHPINANAFAGIAVAIEGVDLFAIAERHAK